MGMNIIVMSEDDYVSISAQIETLQKKLASLSSSVVAAISGTSVPDVVNQPKAATTLDAKDSEVQMRRAY